jgi:long-subunit fatty acid transport protein
MKRFLNFTIAGMMLASPAISGGWEAGRLDSSFIYQEGSYAEVGTSSIDFDVKGKTQANKTHKMAKDQTRTSLAFKMEYGDFDIGLTRYMSGAIQLDGQNTAAKVDPPGCNPLVAAAAANVAQAGYCSIVPSADVTAHSIALLGKYSINDNISVLGGLNRYDVETSTVTTVAGHYVVSGDEMAPVVGAAYENKEIALRVELMVQAETDMTLSAKSSLSPLDPTAPSNISGAKLVIPQTMTLTFQSGIAEDTLLFGSIHKADWKTAQIAIPANATHASGAVTNVDSDFANRTAYSIGIGRKLNDSISVLGSYATEGGGGATSTDPFTLTDGSQTIALGARYTYENMTVSGGYSYTKVGDVKMTHATGLSSDYKDNKVTGIGLKIGFSF